MTTISQEIERLPIYRGTAWRAESGYSHGRADTAGDVIRFERDELGNDFGLSEELIEELDQYHASDLIWATKERQHCLRYLSEGESDACVHQPFLGKSPRIIADTGEEGLLILHGDAMPMSQWAKTERKPLYRARIIPLYDGHRQEDKAFWDYTHAPSMNQASYFLMRRYPFPKFFVEKPVLDTGEKKEAIMPANHVRRTNPSLDAMVKHLGYESVDAAECIRTDADIVRESQERLKRVEIIPDRSLSPTARTSLSLAKRIADDVASNRRVRGVRAAAIPPASDRVITAGMYARSSEEVYISTAMLDRGKTTLDSTIHEMAHHNSGAEDGDAAHSAEISRIGGLVVKSVASRKYDDIIGRPEFSW